jgi:hypothetical protein
MTHTAEIELSANRTMVSYLKAMHNKDPGLAANILAVTVYSPESLAAFVEALGGFSLAMMHTAAAMAEAAGLILDPNVVLDSMANRLAMADTMDDAFGNGQTHD